MSSIRLSILDQSPVGSGRTAVDALTETIELAKLADRLGYSRYWVAEHHATGSLAGPSPEIMVARLAAETERIRVGSGGVMLSHYSPLKVAENFRVLEALYPGRIDLGLGRAPGSDQLTAAALAYGNDIGWEYFPTKVADMLAFLTDTKPPTQAFAHIEVSPATESPPEPWLLGSSDQSALLAAKFGLAFSFAQFITPEHGEAVMNVYRENFHPSEICCEPKGNVAVFAICAETELEARRLGKSRDLVMLRRARGLRGPFPSIEEAEAYPYTKQDLAVIATNTGRSFYGNPEQCCAHIARIAALFSVEEVVVLTICHDPTARRRSYELLAEVFEL